MGIIKEKDFKWRVEYNLDGIEGLNVLEPLFLCAESEYLYEMYNVERFNNVGLKLNFVQDNEVYSRKGVLRGFHVNKNILRGR